MGKWDSDRLQSRSSTAAGSHADPTVGQQSYDASHDGSPARSLSSARSRFSEIKLAHGSADGLLPLHHPLLLLHHRNPHQAPPPLHPLGLPRGAQRSWPPAPRQTSPGAPRLQGRPPTLLARCSGQERGRGGSSASKNPARASSAQASSSRAAYGTDGWLAWPVPRGLRQ